MNEDYSGKPAYDPNCKLTEEDIIKCIDYVATQTGLTVDRMNKGIETTLKEIKELKEGHKRNNSIL
ncbi:hypothetical protein COY26_04810 [Candidatus Woesearchaeota archaeon CG_4_10_14_0_2_um_filter_33_10]|nr:MAG: hypothetical protein AUJ83_01735 [Candidatus Woesearchaeota archaeon CG1_02_33_12]PIN78727.1 MAG: hypothetical protein COV14_02220 [Candidatus Woesearchaeota archaeon CG10_big_fil_rev_8_21_14_0_10_33_12]PIZ52295.1 MAG: hypothetical protein COY26_04810 [Candidatus Woesearchaeota archaeon CG_4_10_14_0_2_um_filter_33_10]